jgi:hypothetical protein
VIRYYNFDAKNTSPLTPLQRRGGKRGIIFFSLPLGGRAGDGVVFENHKII